MNPYISCPSYETRHFTLRLVCVQDAEALLACYSDPASVARMNADNCRYGFCCHSLKEMEQTIATWQEAFEHGQFMRLAIIPKVTGQAAGTIEIFGGDWGILRLDLKSEYETPENIGELLEVSIFELARDFSVGRLCIKAQNTPERVETLRQYGFAEEMAFRPGKGYYARPLPGACKPELGIAFCGLACCVCAENDGCDGCRESGCARWAECKSFTCCQEKGLSGCRACTQYPCENPMLAKRCVRAFGRIAARLGENVLVQALALRAEEGLLYHYPNEHVGDYDHLSSEEEIIRCVLRDRIAKEGLDKALHC